MGSEPSAQDSLEMGSEPSAQDSLEVGSEPSAQDSLEMGSEPSAQDSLEVGSEPSAQDSLEVGSQPSAQDSVEMDSRSMVNSHSSEIEDGNSSRNNGCYTDGQKCGSCDNKVPRNNSYNTFTYASGQKKLHRFCSPKCMEEWEDY
jgi:hypothetical protein